MVANKTYVAEREVWHSKQAKKYFAPIHIQDAQNMVLRAGISRKESADGLSTASCTVRCSRYVGDSAYYDFDNHQITIRRSSPYWVFIHELAHARTGLADKGHGKVFRREYIAVTRLFIGEYWAKRLLNSFKRHNLEVSK